MKGKLGILVLIIFAAILVLLFIALLFLYLYPGIGKTPTAAQRASYLERTIHFDGKKFSNAEKSFKTITGTINKKSDRAKPADIVPVIKSESIPDAEEGKMYVTWLGHSSTLVQMGNKNILIDPVLKTYASPVTFTGSKRFSELAIEPEHIPDIDVLLISHDHYDHLDYQTVMTIDGKVKNYIVPLGVESYLLGWGIGEDKIHVVSWWDEVSLDGITFTSTPAQHYSSRNPLLSNTTWWTGYYFQNDTHSVYYTGDSGYCDAFREIGERFSQVDLALIESGQYENGWSGTHMFPEESVQAAADVNAKWFIPVHWGAFVLANHAWDEPVSRTAQIAADQNMQEATPMIGQRVDYSKISSYQDQWWKSID